MKRKPELRALEEESFTSLEPGELSELTVLDFSGELKVFSQLPGPLVIDISNDM